MTLPKLYKVCGIQICDHRKAFDLYQKSLRNGYVTAYQILGDCYNIGMGTNIDEEKAFEYYQVAAKNKLNSKYGFTNR
ncbi:24220_t:CDS:2 [Racocetra persica]|uniref:24220_t:CDS:1 n=1 Tax=Racocetra persica TaxID=160502 RepID=A0ACA9LQ84_9GLOM|nr:24220_t:CDS:2 [Racocetra persica]